MIKIEVQSTQATIRSQKPLTVGLRGAKAQFIFGESWENLSKTAVFRQGDKTVAVANIGAEVTIPWEVLTAPGVPVQIGVYGIDSTGDLAIPTVWAVTKPVRPGTDPEGDPSAEPTPGLWEQMQGQMGGLDQLQTQAKSSLVSAINEANRAVYVVTVTKNQDGSYAADTHPDERANAYRSGKMLLCYWKEHELLMPLSYPNGGREFVFRTVKDQSEYSVKMTSNENVECTCVHLATEESKLPNPKKLTIIGAETAEYDGAEEVEVEIPTKVSQLTNDRGYLTKAPVTSVNGQTGAVNLSVPLRVTVEELANGVIQSDPPYEELAELRNEGHLLYCQYGSLELPLAAVTPYLYIFSCVQGGKVHTVMIGSSSVTMTATPLASGGGTDGITPHIGENGNWFIGDTDTGMPSRGADAPQEAVLYTPQPLTEAQKAQARENIGINALPSGGEWRLIHQLDIDETNQINSWTITQDLDGNPLELTKLLIRATTIGTAKGDGYITFNNEQNFFWVFSMHEGTGRNALSVEMVGNLIQGIYSNGIAADTGRCASITTYHKRLKNTKINSINWKNASSVKLEPGSSFTIYGC